MNHSPVFCLSFLDLLPVIAPAACTPVPASPTAPARSEAARPTLAPVPTTPDASPTAAPLPAPVHPLLTMEAYSFQFRNPVKYQVAFFQNGIRLTLGQRCHLPGPCQGSTLHRSLEDVALSIRSSSHYQLWPDAIRGDELCRDPVDLGGTVGAIHGTAGSSFLPLTRDPTILFLNGLDVTQVPVVTLLESEYRLQRFSTVLIKPQQ